MWQLAADYHVKFPTDCRPSEIVIFPSTRFESRGMEDLRLVRFADAAEIKYLGTYTAYNGSAIRPMLIESTDFHDFHVSPMSGSFAKNKGIAIFPRKIDGRYCAVSRHDSENLFLLRSKDVRVWNQAEKLMKAYKSNIPEIEAFKQETIKQARLTGFAETYFGRRRLLPDITSPNTAERQKSERQAVNTKIQGTAADIVKFSLVNLYKAGFRINTMLHDGILITVPEDEVEESIPRIKAIMEIELEGLRLPVTCKTGKLWSDCYE